MEQSLYTAVPVEQGAVPNALNVEPVSEGTYGPVAHDPVRCFKGPAYFQFGPALPERRVANPQTFPTGWRAGRQADELLESGDGIDI